MKGIKKGDKGLLMSKRVPIRFILNGKEITDIVEGDLTLLRYLRRDQHLTGAKEGCGQGLCGTCTVIVNGEPLKSCSVRMSDRRLKDASIFTIEGIAPSEDELHPLQSAFIWAGAVQCGFCTPGMILTAKALLDKNAAPTRSEIRSYLEKRNLCRCTGYQKIVDAIEDAARMMRGETSRLAQLPEDTCIGRKDASEKVTGRLKYGDDLELDGMIYGKLVFASEPHAVVKKVDVREAGSMRGVVGALTADDIPGSRKIGLVIKDQPALVGVGEEVRCIGDLIAAVFAETPELAARAAQKVVVEYEPLPGVFSMEEAWAEAAPLVSRDLSSNLFWERRLERGDVDDVFSRCHAIVEDEFSFSSVIHGYLEPEVAIAYPDEEGGAAVLYPTQSVYDGRDQVSEVLGLPKDKVRVIQLPTGGAFGGKEGLIHQHLVALAAVRFGRPTKITLTREESLRASYKKTPMRIRVRLGMDEDARFLALDASIKADKGAYGNLGETILSAAMTFIGGVYYIPHVRITGEYWYTNKVLSGTMRGIGAVQANFAIESIVDMAARKTGLSPFDIRLLNGLKAGLPTVTDHVLEPGVLGARETIEAAREEFEKIPAPRLEGNTKLGVGVACGIKSIGWGHGIPESAAAVAELTPDGHCLLTLTHHELGQGANMGQARIASEMLGIPIERISVSVPDTAKTPYTGSTTASRQTFLTGNATAGACSMIKSELFTRAAQKLGVLEPASFVIQGDSVVERSSGRSIKIGRLGTKFIKEYRAFPPETDGFPPEGEKSKYGTSEFKSLRTYAAYACGTQIAWVEVDERTGAVRVLKVLTVVDAGRTLNQRAVEGQQEGGIAMGTGYALSEEFKVEQGVNVTRTLKQCGLPTAVDVPEVITRIVEVPHPATPLGMKGMAETSSLATAPAIANAVFDAIGVRTRDLPISKDGIKEGWVPSA